MSFLLRGVRTLYYWMFVVYIFQNGLARQLRASLQTYRLHREHSIYMFVVYIFQNGLARQLRASLQTYRLRREHSIYISLILS
jgi:hypothetical protein